GAAINNHLRTEVPRLDIKSSAFKLPRDQNEKWSAVKQNLDDATSIVRTGTEELVGCSVVVAISDKEVWMGKLYLPHLRETSANLLCEGHFVEDTGFGEHDLDTPEGQRGFRDNVLAGISGPATNKYPTIKSEEARLNPKIGTASRRPKSVVVWIITGQHNGNERMYPDEVELMQAELKKTLSLDNDPEVHQYEVVDGKDPRFDTEALGTVLFEYDPNNNGQKSWRLLAHKDLIQEGVFPTDDRGGWMRQVNKGAPLKAAVSRIAAVRARPLVVDYFNYNIVNVEMVLPYLGSDPAKLDADPHWALNRAAERGNLDALEAIIAERRSDPDYPNLIADLDLPLETSARKCDLPMITYLLDEGAIVSGRVISSAIHPFSGVMADALPVFKLFKENGWSVNALGVRGESIFL
ncbi:MAG: hypothetical protein Q9180_007507, partial [Flavoplaca navasiana]